MTNENTKPLLLTFKHTTSKGRDTYGYNICTLYVDGLKVSSCKGGGYDMQGTALGMYLTREYQTQLMTIASRAYTVSTQSKGMWWVREKNESGLYGMELLKPQRLAAHVVLDGGCGQSSIEQIAKAAGITLTSTITRKTRNTTEWGYFLTV